MIRASFVLLLLASSPLVMANTIYKCTDENGGTLISNTKVDKNCKPVVTGPDSSMPPPKVKTPSAAANPSPAGFPKVAEDTQKSRDGDRRRILEQELTAEQKNLDAARKELAEQEANRSGDDRNAARRLDRLQPYKERVAQHERNIQAINKEIAGLK